MKKDQAIKVSAVGILYVLAGVILSYTVSLELRPEHPANNFIRVQWALIFIAVLTAATVIAWKSTTCNQIRHALMKSYTCGLLLYYLYLWFIAVLSVCGIGTVVFLKRSGAFSSDRRSGRIYGTVRYPDSLRNLSADVFSV